MQRERKYNQNDLEQTRKNVYDSLSEEEKGFYGNLESLSTEDANSLLINSFGSFDPQNILKPREVNITEDYERSPNGPKYNEGREREFVINGKLVSMVLDHEYQEVVFGPSPMGQDPIKIDFLVTSSTNWQEADSLYSAFCNYVGEQIQEGIRDKIKKASFPTSEEIRRNLDGESS